MPMHSNPVGAPFDLPVKIVRPLLETWGLPERGSSASAGLDVRACLDEEVVIAPGQRSLIPTGFAMHLGDPGLAALLVSRSGLGAKQGLTVAQGVGLIDSDYTGEVMVMLLNTADEPRTVSPGDRIAQLVIVPVFTPNLILVEELDSTERGAGGFGSSGNR